MLFDTKNFNAEVFGRYVDSIPNVNLNEMYKSKAIKRDGRLKSLFAPQTGSFKGTLPYFGRLSGDPVNYDGETDITTSTPDTFTQGFVVVGRAKGFLEKDFSSDITGGVKFMDRVGMGIAEYWANIYQGGLLSVLKGIYSMTGADNLKFVNGHTHDVTADGDGKFGATTLNTALQKASGDAKSQFSIAFMHSKVATDLENLQLLDYLKYTDANGIQRNLTLGTLNGRIVIVDDGMPTEEVAESATGKGDGYTKYTTYVLGEGAITLEDVGALVPYEMARNAAQNGGETALYSRKRFVIAPDGISFVGTPAKKSPTDAELEAGSSWSLIDNGQTGSKKAVFPHKKIAIARIITR